jgi:alpha-L-rhamnosidase
MRLLHFLVTLFTATSSFAITIESTSCEGEEHPLGLETTSPSFSWILFSREPGQHQSAYQLHISVDEQKLLNGQSLIYNSGKTISDQSIFVSAKNFKPDSKQRYFWRVRVWDKDGAVSEWSEPAWFEMGVLDKADWQAQWISAPTLFDWRAVDGRRKEIAKEASPELPEPAPIFRKEFSLQKKITSARAYISGLGYYELLLNGKKVGERLLDPAFTRYDKRALYVVYDVTQNLCQGDNALGVMLGNGWYDMSSRGVWGYDHAPWRADPTFILQLEAKFDDGSVERIVSDEAWKCAPGPIVFTELRQGEWYDARQEQPGWASPKFDDTGWHSVRSARGPEGRLAATSMPPTKERRAFKPKSIKAKNSGVYVVDFGQNMAGFVRLHVSGKEGTEIELKYGEELNEKGLVDQSEIGKFVANTPFQTDKYILKGEGVETWQPRFVYHGFQYVEVHGFPGTPNVENLTAVAVNTSFQPAGEFSCSNELFNSIQHSTLWSYMNNYVGYPTDCPQREKNGWTGDAQLAAEAGLFNFDSRTSYIKWMQDIADEQQPSGEFAAIIPTAGWGYYWGNGPAWDCAFLLIPWYIYLYTGDDSIIKENYEPMKRYVDFLTREKSKDGIVSWGLGDWCPAKTKTPSEITSTAYYFVDAQLMQRFAQVVGNSNDAKKYADLATSIRSAFIAKFVDSITGAVGNDSQTALGCALYQGLAPDALVEIIVEKLAEDVKENGNKLDYGILGSKYVPNALADFGYRNLVYAMINHTDFPGYGHWIEQGATTLWENWEGGGSLNHVMFGDVSAWFYKHLGGIQPDPNFPGFKHFFVRPFFPADLQWAKASYKSMYGLIKSEWTRTGDKVQLNINVPVNTTATVELPKESTLCSPAEAPAGKAEMDSNAVQYNLGSGEYCFKINMME